MRNLIIALLLVTNFSFGQVYTVEKSNIIFFSDAIVEDITASNIKASALLDLSKGEVAFQVPIKDFEFEKDLMKQHFNEKYMDTEKYPVAQFGGKFTGFDKAKSGEQQVIAEGKLIIHGVTRMIKIPGTIEIAENKKVLIKAKFIVKLADYKIKIPQVVWQNIAEEVEVKIEFLMKQN
jgi:polyisoprenoid-binding protein YceI